MPLPRPHLDVEPSEKVLALRRKRRSQHQKALRSARFRAVGWELTGRLTVNLMLTLVALAALIKLVPYHQTQRQVLQELEASIATLSAHNSGLRSDFARYFDPAQTSQVLQENGPQDSPQRVPIVWVDQRANPSAVTEPNPTELHSDESPTPEPTAE
ncbi:MAG: hypothetical protein AAGF98_19190 [Cyanobacteria bacterium P01_H01_bin.153]